MLPIGVATFPRHSMIVSQQEPLLVTVVPQLRRQLGCTLERAGCAPRRRGDVDVALELAQLGAQHPAEPIHQRHFLFLQTNL